MAEFMLQHLHIDENEVPKICLDLYKEYGTTMAGLKVKIVQLGSVWNSKCQFVNVLPNIETIKSQLYNFAVY